MTRSQSQCPDDRSATLAIQWESGDLEIALRRTVRGPETVLFIHGLGCSKASFDGAWDSRLADQLTLVAVDLPGFGASARPREFSYTMSDQSLVLLALLDRLGADRVHLVCHSMGGAVGLLLAQSLGNRLASFVNVEGNLLPQDSGMISRRAAKAGFDRFEGRTFPALRKAVGASTEPAMESLAQWLAQADPWAFWRSSVSLVEWSDRGDLLTIYRQLSAPRLYVYGTNSVLQPVLVELAGLPSAAVAHSGHFVMQDAPAPFWSLVEQTVLGDRLPPDPSG
jgi:pimeloyl-ACP methyl ester carboxylesterase